ncbi:MAG: restriction endonuclease subunit S [Chitinophagaceae bacterium]|nr:restriction endonuclease subunit S [Chitinophagaceae bacterium]
MVAEILHKKKLLAPKLRFKEFNESWKSVKLGDIGSTNGGLTYSPNDVVEDENKGVLVLRSSNVQDGMISFHDNVYVNCSITEKDLVRENDILLCVRNGSKNLIGKSLLIKKEHVGFAFGAFMAIYRSDSNQFIFHFFKSAKFYKQVHEHLGATINQITGKSLNSFKLLIPALPEQKKIASFLSAVDEKTQLFTRKKELLEQYKKGVMQQLFSGNLRFKDDNGNAFPKWEEKRICEISEKKSSNIAANAIAENIGDYKIYGATGFLKKVDFYREEEPYISIVKDGAGVGRTLLCDAKTSVLGTLDIIKPIVSVDLYFLYSLLNSIDFVKYTKGSTIPHIYYKDYSTEKIQLPYFEEQKKIANYLSIIDNKIEIVNKQITQTQTFKKGLLQQMFV